MNEQVNSLFSIPQYQITERIYRVEIAGNRHYRRESGRLYKSLTTFLSAVMPQNRFLQTWREKMAADLGSAEKAAEYVQATADYGTLLHIAVADYSRFGGVEWQAFDTFVFEYLQNMKLEPGALAAAQKEVTKDFASILQFFHDYNVRVLAVEIPCFSEHGIATLVDLVVEMDSKNYDKTPAEKRERHRAIINLKSGKKGFFEEHIFQLAMERAMFNETYQEDITEVYNLAPSDWKDKPTYKLKNQTDEIEAQKIEQQLYHFIELGKIRGVLSSPKKPVHVFTGKTEYGANPTDNLKTYQYNDFVNLKLFNNE